MYTLLKSKLSSKFSSILSGRKCLRAFWRQGENQIVKLNFVPIYKMLEFDIVMLLEIWALID